MDYEKNVLHCLAMQWKLGYCLSCPGAKQRVNMPAAYSNINMLSSIGDKRVYLCTLHFLVAHITALHHRFFDLFRLDF